jgi:hypothetical protein
MTWEELLIATALATIVKVAIRWILSQEKKRQKEIKEMAQISWGNEKATETRVCDFTTSAQKQATEEIKRNVGQMLKPDDAIPDGERREA